MTNEWTHFAAFRDNFKDDYAVSKCRRATRDEAEMAGDPFYWVIEDAVQEDTDVLTIRKTRYDAAQAILIGNLPI